MPELVESSPDSEEDETPEIDSEEETMSSEAVIELAEKNVSKLLAGDDSDDDDLTEVTTRKSGKGAKAKKEDFLKGKDEKEKTEKVPKRKRDSKGENSETKLPKKKIVKQGGNKKTGKN